MTISNRFITTAITIAMAFTAVAASGQCKKRICPTGGYGYSQPYYQPAQPQYPVVYDTPVVQQEPIDDDEQFLDDEQFVEFKAVECEVQVQHPLTFDWRTVKEFGTEDEAYAYQEQIEQRYWVIYQARGVRKQSYLEANDKSDARSKVAALRQNGSRVKKIAPVEVQVVEKSIAPIFAEDDALVLENIDLDGQPDSDTAIESESQVETAFSSLAQPATKIQSELAPLVGLWKATTEQADGEVAAILLELRDDGSATLTVPDAKGGTASLSREVSLTDGNLLLSNGSNTLNLGKVESAEANQVIIARAEGQFTFVRQ